ncbi:MAG: hypothetical protein AAFP90_20870, partial [Planctomycetota bacterium]
SVDERKALEALLIARGQLMPDGRSTKKTGVVFEDALAEIRSRQNRERYGETFDEEVAAAEAIAAEAIAKEEREAARANKPTERAKKSG